MSEQNRQPQTDRNRCRWPVDRAVAHDAGELVELATVMVAPRLDAWIAARHDEAKAATAVPELLGGSEAMATKATLGSSESPPTTLTLYFRLWNGPVSLQYTARNGNDSRADK